MLRALTRFSIAVLIGVGATLGWQSYGDATKEMLAVRALTLAGVLSVSTTKSPVVAATSTDPMQQLAPLASNLDVVLSSVEQLAAKQEQMAQNIAASQPKAQSSAVQPSSVPRPTPSTTVLALTPRPWGDIDKRLLNLGPGYLWRASHSLRFHRAEAASF